MSFDLLEFFDNMDEPPQNLQKKKEKEEERTRPKRRKPHPAAPLPVRQIRPPQRRKSFIEEYSAFCGWMQRTRVRDEFLVRLLKKNRRFGQPHVRQLLEFYYEHQELSTWGEMEQAAQSALQETYPIKKIKQDRAYGMSGEAFLVFSCYLLFLKKFY